MQGSLGEFRLAEILQLVAVQQKTGLLRLVRGEEMVTFYFDRGILVSTREAAEDLGRRITTGEEFAELARRHSTCESAVRGGDLGQLSPGEMVREFDNVAFTGEPGVVHGPIKSPLGYHLIEVLARHD